MSAPYRSGDRLWWCETAGQGQVAVYSATVCDVTQTDESTWTVGTDRGQTVVDSQGDGLAGVQVGLLDQDVAPELDMRGEGYIVESSATDPDYAWHLDIDMDREG